MGKGKVYLDLKEKLHEGSNPQEWDRPKLSWERSLFRKHRHVYCRYYKLCMNYAAGLYWEGWSCNWCEHNPYRNKEEGEIEAPKPRTTPHNSSAIRRKLAKNRKRKRKVKPLKKIKHPPKKKMDPKVLDNLRKELNKLCDW